MGVEFTEDDWNLECKITQARLNAAIQPANSQQQLQATMAVLELIRGRRPEIVAFMDACQYNRVAEKSLG